MKIGVIGGGQLGRMLALAGTPLGMNFAFLDPAPDACAAPWASTCAPTTATRTTCASWPTKSTW
jgi:phosphoribosylaminoimidazole carboxylase (NCAIR synthetase)